MKLKILFIVMFSCILMGCGGESKKDNKVNEIDTIDLGDLREKFKDDSLFYKVVVPDLVLIQNQYSWLSTVKQAKENGLSERYYRRVLEEIDKTNELIRDGIMKGANPNRIYDFQKGKQ